MVRFGDMLEVWKKLLAHRAEPIIVSLARLLNKPVQIVPRGKIFPAGESVADHRGSLPTPSILRGRWQGVECWKHLDRIR